MPANSKKSINENYNNDQPEWVARLLRIYTAGVAHAFILHFNVNDYVDAGRLLPPLDYLSQMLASRVVARYSRDRGIEFATASQRKQALEILGLGGNANNQQPNSALAALQAVGAAPATSESTLPRSPTEALPMLDKLLRYVSPPSGGTEGGANFKGTAVIIEAADLVCPDGPLATMSPDDRTALAVLSRWGRDAEIVAAGNPVILLTPNLAGLHADLRAATNRYESIAIPLPGQPARLDFIRKYRRQSLTLSDTAISQAANATAGLSLLHIEDILLRAEQEGKLTARLIWERKEDIIRSEFGDVLEIIEPRWDFDDVGGLQHVKDFFQRSVIRPIAEGRFQRVPMGVLMTGPAGTGKSIMAEAVAREASINAVKLRIGGQIASKWQGEGERNLEKALKAIEGLAPTIVFIDEIDQAVQRGQGSGGSQQDQRIFQRLLEFMSDTAHRGQIVFLAATNRPDLMDAALRRPGRFDKKIPFLVPDDSERVKIIDVMGRRYLGVETWNEPMLETLELSQGWTGAEIEAAAVKAAELVEDENPSPATALRQAVQRLSPSTADIELMTYLAVQECNDRDLLPPSYQALLDDRTALAGKVDDALARQQPQPRQQRSL